MRRTLTSIGSARTNDPMARQTTQQERKEGMSVREDESGKEAYVNREETFLRIAGHV